MSSSLGMAPVPPGFLKLLSVTFTTFAVFPSWMYLLGGDDDCMLAVPSGTCELHISCWQGSDSCQAIAAATLTLFNYALWFLLKADDFFCSVLPTCYVLHDSRVLGLTLRPSAPVCCCHRVFLDTREAGICARNRALSSFIFPPFGSSFGGTCLVA